MKFEVYRTIEINGEEMTTIYGTFDRLDLANLFHYHFSAVSGFDDLYVRTVNYRTVGSV